MTRRLLGTLSFGLTLAGFAGGASASAGTPGNLLRPTLVLGAALPVANGVKAGPMGAEWALPGGARLSAEAGAELRVIAAPQHLDLGGRHKVPSYTVVLSSGLLHVHAPADGSTALIVAAPRKTSVIVAAGQASVMAGEQIAVANADGTTSIGLPGQRFHAVDRGMVEVVGLPKRPLLATPAMSEAPSVLLSYGEPVGLAAYSWSAVPGARGYRVELRDAKGSILSRTETEATTLPAGFAALEPGAYSLRLAAIDNVGLESAHAVERQLRVVGVTLPTGGFVDEKGAVRFPVGLKLGLSGVEGVEMTYGNHGEFAQAPQSLALFRTQPSLLRFRAKGAEAAQELWLMPRTVRARVAFGSQRPTWPGAPLEIKVALEDASEGTPIEVTPQVTVGVERVPVAFTRSGQSWRGVLPARSGAGPWVVRVEVKDQHGIALGRDFVEVAAKPVARGAGGT